MPFYEGIGLIAEKNAVVIDVGAAYTKVGYAGETSPRAIIPTPNFPPLEDTDELYEAMVKFVHRLYFKHLLVNPRDRRVVLLDPLLGPSKLKQVLSKVLFHHFEALSLLLAPSVLMPLLTLGIPTALVIDCGLDETTFLPVYEGVPVLKAWKGGPKGGAKAVHAELRHLLESRAKFKTGNGDLKKLSESPELMERVFAEDVLEDIKVRLCFVTNLDRAAKIRNLVGPEAKEDADFNQVSNAIYPVSGDTILHIDGATREAACEVIFEKDDDGHTLPSLILDSLLSSPIDTRSTLAANIVFVGGGSMTLGFKPRLIQELRKLLNENNYYNEKLACLANSKESLKLHVPPTKANYTTWTGASILGATDAISTRSFTRDMYMKEKNVVPDWSDMRFNTLFREGDDVFGSTLK